MCTQISILRREQVLFLNHLCVHFRNYILTFGVATITCPKLDLRTENAQIFYTEGTVFTGPYNDVCDANCTPQKANSAMWSDFVPGM